MFGYSDFGDDYGGFQPPGRGGTGSRRDNQQSSGKRRVVTEEFEEQDGYGGVTTTTTTTTSYESGESDDDYRGGRQGKGESRQQKETSGKRGGVEDEKDKDGRNKENRGSYDDRGGARGFGFEPPSSSKRADRVIKLRDHELNIDELLQLDMYGGGLPPPPNVTAADEEELFEEKLMRKLEENLDTPVKIESENKKEAKEEIYSQAVLTYAETLHRGLKIMWVPMVYLGRMPFRLIMKDNRAIIVVRKLTPAYIACLICCILSWFVFTWMTLGLLTIMLHASLVAGIRKDEQTNEDRQVPISLLRRFWPETFIMWTTMLQACISTTHILIRANNFALFIKAWYHVLDITKIEVSKTLKRYIIINQAMLVVFILVMIILYHVPGTYPQIHGTSMVIIVALAEPFILITELMTEDEQDAQMKGTEETSVKEEFYAMTFAPVGLVLYIFAILFSWTYIMQFMVFSRCFRKGLNRLNERIAIVLEIKGFGGSRRGENSVRLSFEEIHKDYLGVATTGMKTGKIFSWTMCNYYLWAILVLVVELGEIFKFAKKDFHKLGSAEQRVVNLLEKKGFGTITPFQEIFNDVVHFTITAFCIFYVSYEGSRAHEEGKMSFELARYRGLVESTNQLERNFIRSIWIIVTEKCPVQISPGRYFGISNNMILTVFATALTYFIFWVQSQGQITGAKHENEGDLLNERATPEPT